MFLKTPAGSPPATACFIGRAHSNAPPVTFTSNRWTFFAWPYARPRFEHEQGPDGAGWGFAAAGAHRGTSWRDADLIFMTYASAPYGLYLAADGRWKVRNSGVAAPVALEHGHGYYYFARGTSFVWGARGASPGTASGGTGGPDSDGDGLDDTWERFWFGGLHAGAGEDPDRDGAANLDEYWAGTNPLRENRADPGSRHTGLGVWTPVL